MTIAESDTHELIDDDVSTYDMAEAVLVHLWYPSQTVRGLPS